MLYYVSFELTERFSFDVKFSFCCFRFVNYYPTYVTKGELVFYEVYVYYSFNIRCSSSFYSFLTAFVISTVPY